MEGAAELTTEKLTGQLRGFVGQCLGKDIVALGQRLVGLLSEALCVLVLLAARDRQLLIVDLSEVSRRGLQKGTNLLVRFSICRRRGGP